MPVGTAIGFSYSASASEWSGQCFCCDQPTTLHESRTDQAAKEGCGGGGRSIQALDWLSDFATLCAMVNALFAIQALSSS
jgi:hypothetical protein